LGALDAITLEVLTITNDAYINAVSVCELLMKISKQNIGLPITIVLDNARYQKCLIVKELAEKLNIELLYLPTYSPNLIIIERLWKFIKKSVYIQNIMTILINLKVLSPIVLKKHRVNIKKN
jgi:transposase